MVGGYIGKPGNGCKVKPLSFEGRIRDAGLKFIRSKEVSNNKDIIDPSGFVKSVFNSVFDLPFEYRHVEAVEPGKVKTFENRLSQIRRAIQKGELHGKFGEFLYNTSARAKMNPYANKLLNDMIDVNYSYKGRRDRHARDFTRIVNSLKDELKVQGFLSHGAKDWRVATKAANKFSEKIDNLRKTTGDKDATKELYNVRKQEDFFYAEGEGKIFGDFIKIIEVEVPKIAKGLNKELWKKRKDLQLKYESGGMNPNDAYNKSVKSIKLLSLVRVDILSLGCTALSANVP